MGIIAERYKEMLESEADRYPVRSNRASEIGHPCEAYLMHLRVNWDKAQPVPFKLKSIFREGEALGGLTLVDLMHMGFKPLKTELPLFDRDLNLSGTLDAVIRIGEKRFPVEIKSCNPHVFAALDNQQDLAGFPKLYTRKWYYQCQAYLMLMHKQEIIMVLRNRLTGELKDFVVTVDDEAIDEIGEKCMLVNGAIEDGAPIESFKIPSEDYCPSCPFNHLCLPDIVREDGVEVIDDPELEEALALRSRLYEAYKAYKEADQLITKKLKGKTAVICGNWLIKGKMIKRKGYTVPDGEYWRKEILPLNTEVMVQSNQTN